MYFEIPNRYYPRYVQKDGHYRLFGITLLDYPDASEYYSLHAPGVPYGVRHYLELDHYRELFDEAGLTLTVMDENLNGFDPLALRADIEELHKSAGSAISGVPAAVRDRVENHLSVYLEEIENATRSGVHEQREVALRYGLGFWQVIGRRKNEGY